jgi:hypothetical protein
MMTVFHKRFPVGVYMTATSIRFPAEFRRIVQHTGSAVTSLVNIDH